MEQSNRVEFTGLSHSDLLGTTQVERADSRQTTAKADATGSTNLLSDVYNWGAQKVQQATQLVEDHPYIATGLAIASAVAVTRGRALLEGSAAFAAKQELSTLGTRALPVLGLTTLVGGSALALSGCSETPGDKQSSDPKQGSWDDKTDDRSKNTDPVSGREIQRASDTAPIVEEKAPVRVYEDSAQCIKDQVFTEKYCTEKFDEAQKMHMETAPKFQTKEDCEKDTGKACVAAPDKLVGTTTGSSTDHHSSGGSWFMPYMIGYMMGSNSNRSTSYSSPMPDRDRDRTGGTGYYGGGAGATRPLYGTPGATTAPSSQREFLTSDGAKIGRTGLNEVPSSSLRVPNTGTVFRSTPVEAPHISTSTSRVGVTESPHISTTSRGGIGFSGRAGGVSVGG